MKGEAVTDAGVEVLSLGLGSKELTIALRRNVEVAIDPATGETQVKVTLIRPV